MSCNPHCFSLSLTIIVSFSLFATLNYKDEEMNNVFFSPDSSLLVMVHPSAISLWNPTAVYTGKNAPSLLRVLSGEGVVLNEGVFVGSSYIAVRATAGAGEACHGVCLVYNLTNCKCECLQMIFYDYFNATNRHLHTLICIHNSPNFGALEC